MPIVIKTSKFYQIYPSKQAVHKQLLLLLAAFQAGNKSKEMKNIIAAHALFSYQYKSITKTFYNKIIKLIS